LGKKCLCRYSSPKIPYLLHNMQLWMFESGLVCDPNLFYFVLLLFKAPTDFKKNYLLFYKSGNYVIFRGFFGLPSDFTA
jgi:hypothetical protein